MVTDITADRVGDEILLHWTTPSKTTDGLLMKGGMTAEVCRTMLPAQNIVPSTNFSGSPHASVAPVCSPVRRESVHAGPSSAVDVLPSALATGPEILLAYRIEIRNAHERSAGLSLPAFAAAGSAPLPVTGLRVKAVAQGALLEWQPQDAADTIELDRMHLFTAAAPVNVASKEHPHTSEKQVAEHSEELRLRVNGTPPGATLFRPDPGGTLDATARRGETYMYKAQRVRRAVLQGQTLEIRSPVPPGITVIMRDSFPPQAPAGLEVIASGGVAPAIDLSWRPNTEPDLAGYIVYRQEAGVRGATVRLTAKPILEPGYRDLNIAAGRTYTYTVTAIDSAENESPASAAASEEVRLP